LIEPIEAGVKPARTSRKAVGIEVPAPLLVRADEMIE
jgi:hypothetical protein